jgi:catechol 2,3-dioxygenase-like lactoylglutathione lyase family enzyme
MVVAGIPGEVNSPIKPAGLLIVMTMVFSVAPPARGAVTGSCHVSPIVSDLDRSLRFYRDLLGLEVSSAPASGAIPWDTETGLLDLHGVPKARLRYFGARIPGVRCGIEPVQFDKIDRKAVKPRLQDVGTVTLILLVRDIDAIFSRLKAAGVPVLTTGGQPLAPVPTSKTRGVLVRDPDGHIVELAQLDPQPATSVPASSNVYDIRFRVTVQNVDEAVAYYRDRLSIPGKPGSFLAQKGVMAMLGLPENVEYRYSAATIPGSSLVLEFFEYRGLKAGNVKPRVQDPGAYRLQLNVDDVSSTIDVLKNSGSRVISTAGKPVRMMFGRPWLLAAAQDPNNIFLILQQGPLQ